MAKQVPWNSAIVTEFIKEGMLSSDEEFIIRTRAKGWSRVKQADALRMSVSNIDKIISRLKQKYDRVAMYDAVLPPRCTSADDTWRS